MNASPVKTHGEERLRLVLEAAKIGYWEWNLATDRVTLGGYTESLLGLTPGAFKGTYKAFFDLMHPDDRATVRQEMSQAVKRCTGYQPEFRIVRPNGEVRWMAMGGRPYLDEAG